AAATSLFGTATHRGADAGGEAAQPLSVSMAEKVARRLMQTSYARAAYFGFRFSTKARAPSFWMSLDYASLRLASACGAALRAPFGSHLRCCYIEQRTTRARRTSVYVSPQMRARPHRCSPR